MNSLNYLDFNDCLLLLLFIVYAAAIVYLSLIDRDISEWYLILCTTVSIVWQWNIYLFIELLCQWGTNSWSFVSTLWSFMSSLYISIYIALALLLFTPRLIQTNFSIIWRHLCKICHSIDTAKVCAVSESIRWCVSLGTKCSNVPHLN